MGIKKIKLGPGQESVWDYPRPPKLEMFEGHIRIEFAGDVICNSNKVFRILETSHPPTYYIPMTDFIKGVLQPAKKTSYCEYKGIATYFDIRSNNKEAKLSAWTYHNPNTRYESIKDHVAVYAHMVDSCFVNDEKVQAQKGDFYGGWITSNIVGPFKGGVGTWGW